MLFLLFTHLTLLSSVTMVYLERLKTENAMLFFSTQRTSPPHPPTMSLQNQIVFVCETLHPTAACLTMMLMQSLCCAAWQCDDKSVYVNKIK